MNLLTAGIFCFFNNGSIKYHTIIADTSNPFSSFTVNYHSDTLKGKTAIANFNKLYSEEQKNIIYAINRISSSVVRTGKVLVMPDTLSKQILDYSPYPDSVAAFDSLPKLILISLRIQAFAIYENGQLTRWGPVSSGKKSTPTPAGLFHTNFKAKVKVSSENSSWIMRWYFNFYAKRGIAFHQYSLPGYPASHACVRMQEKDAKWVFDWADQWKVSGKTGAVTATGTPVIVFGDYIFGTASPWVNLPKDNQSTMLTAQEFEEIYSYLPKINSDIILRK
jgi:lipoprotein-anchoring transpeptidase ErfK/SrfK